MNEIKLLKKLISIDSQTQKSNWDIVNFIQSLFPKNICAITKFKKNKVDLYNLAIKFKGKKNKNPLIFSGHTDTVPVSNQWTKNPFKAEINNDKIWGLGSSDMKAGLASIITAALTIKSPPPQDTYLLFDADEEETCLGGKLFVQNTKINSKTAKIIVAEPTGGKLFIGQKGVFSTKITFAGRAMHSSLATYQINKKNNAIYKALQAIQELQKLEIILEKKQDVLFGFGTQSINQINGGIADNIIADQCSFKISRRFLPQENPEKILKKIKTIVQKIDDQVKIELLFLGEANILKRDSSLLLTAEKISKLNLGQSKIEVAPYWTQAGLFKKWGECLIWGPGEIKMAHQPNEYCLVKEVKQMSNCYQQFFYHSF